MFLIYQMSRHLSRQLGLLYQNFMFDLWTRQFFVSKVSLLACLFSTHHIIYSFQNVSLEGHLRDPCIPNSLCRPYGCELLSYTIATIYPRYSEDMNLLKEFYLIDGVDISTS